MKLKRTRSLSLPKAARRGKRGFALIATLTLMMLLAILATAIMATASSQNRIAMQTVLQAEARQQALVGLDAAIGELQAELGPDQRITANSGIISESEGSTPQHLLGVWDSFDGPIYGRSSHGKIQGTYSQGRASHFRRWLISSRDRNATHTMKAAANLCNRKPGQRICLVGEGTLGKSLNARHYVYADMLTMPATGKNKACFAWWVSGENQKAKISVKNRKETADPMEALHRTWDTPGPVVVESRALDFLPERIEEPAKIVTLGTLPLLDSSSQAAGAPYFYDVTTTSYSLPVNLRTGGLKQDLNLLLNKSTLQGTAFASRHDQDCPIAEGRDVPGGTASKMPIGSWQNLHAYYHCWPGSGQGAGILSGTVSNASTEICGNLTACGNNTFFENRADAKNAGYARQPIMLAFMTNFALWTADTNQVEKRTGPDGSVEMVKKWNLGLAYAPHFLWWNPYNVPMRVKANKMWAYTSPYHTAWIQKYGIHHDSKGYNRLSWHHLVWQLGTAERNEYGRDCGDYFTGAGGGDIVFRPGEVLFFSPLAEKATSRDTQQNPMAPGYRPSSISNNTMYLYSNVAMSAVDSTQGKFPTQLRLGTGTEEWVNNLTNAGVVSYAHPISYALASGHDECLSVLHGFDGISSNDKVKEGFRFSEGEAPDPARLPSGKNGLSAQSMLLGWYDPKKTGEGGTLISPFECWRGDGSQSDPHLPYYIAAVGVVAKSANPDVDERLFPGRDYRTKLWQHSSPAFWGSALVNPNEQQRQYHPYQLAALDAGAGLSTSPISSIGNNGFIGVTADGEQVSFASVLELPVHPPFSLAGFAGMRLTPGWYQTSGSSGLGAMRRMQYQAGVPGVGIGNAFADPCLPAGDVYVFHEYNSDLKDGDSRTFGDFYDHALLINDALWDSWFCSSVSDMPSSGGKKAAQRVLSDFLSGKEPLPVSRYKKTSNPYNDEAIISRVMADDGWKNIAQYLMIDGGFNVNSTSVEAWAAVLQGLAKRKLVSNNGNSLKIVESAKSDSQVVFSRFMLSTTDRSVDSVGGYSMRQGGSFRDGGLSAWSEVRMLEPEGIRRLAEEMVKQVRKRGPFLNMSDFINRRLDSAGGETALKGALQAAIDATDINREFQEIIVKPQNGDLYSFPEAEKGSMYTAAPGYLIQSDVLASLGNILTLRDDTFTVRAYGCVKNARNNILAQAWCEAVVQRTMEYVDPSNAPTDAEKKPDGSNGTGLSPINRVMGRQFRIVSFKWLDFWDI